MDLNFLLDLTERICTIGKNNKQKFEAREIKIFKSYFSENGILKTNELDEDDGTKFTRREILSRYLLMSVILDQGPDIKGVRLFFRNIINELYQNEIRILHNPISFFEKFNISINKLIEEHNSIKKIRAEEWAKENNSKATKYYLFFAQSQRGIVSNKVLDYAGHRIGVPLLLFY